MNPSERLPKPRRRLLWIVGGVVVFLLIIGELTCRWWFGLGDPPLYQAHPDIEYLLQPSQRRHRFGNVIAINQWSMRSEEFPQRKTDPRELRILVLGDSVIHGGAFTDQAALATSKLQARLAEALQIPVVVGNAAAGSWGPPNMLAYVKAFGVFDADIVIVVVGSEDYGDVPTFAPLGPEHPQRSPRFALQEAFQRYVPRLIAYRGVNEAPPSNPSAKDVLNSMDALRELLDTIKLSGAKALVALHAERTEVLQMNFKLGAQAIASVAASRQTPVIQMSDEFVKMMGRRVEPYRDWIHPNEHGQSAIAECLFQWIMSEPR